MKIGALRWRLILRLFFVWTQTMPLLAQDPTNNYCINPQGAEEGGFTLDKNRVCAGSIVSVTGGIPSGMVNIGYIPQYNGRGIPASNQLVPSFQYTRPGSYTILQVGTINGSRALKCQTVTVLPLDPVTFTVKSCSGRNVTLMPDVPSLGQYDTYVISWGDGNTEQLSRDAMAANPQHTYATTGSNTPTITVEGVYGSITIPICKSPSQQTVTLTGTLTQPVITTLKTLNDNTIILQYQASAGAPVQLYQKVNGTYTDTGQRGTGPGAFTVQTDAKQVQCFQVVAQDACSPNGLRSDDVCSLVLTARSDNKKNIVSWQPYTGTMSATSQFRYYRLTRNNAPIGGTIVNPNTTTYTDDNTIECRTQYCYSLVATIDGNAQTEVTSAPVCVTGVNGNVLDNLGLIAVSIDNNKPKLTVDLPFTGTPSSYTLLISRSDGASGAFQPVGTLVDQRTFVDDQANPSSNSYCYQVNYQGTCGLTLPASNPVCTVFLSAPSKKDIDWTAESPFTPGSVLDYTVEVIDSVSGSTRTIPMGVNTRYNLEPNGLLYTYRIVATSGSNKSYSNYLTFPREDRFMVPDAFTPNGDQMNDTFLPKGVSADQFLMNIYSRWGDVVYSTTDKTKGWDGLINGQPASLGQYMYRIEIKDSAGQKTVRTGALLLIR